MDVLTDKSYKSTQKISRYTKFPYYYHRIDDKYVYGTTSYLDDSTPYTTYTLTFDMYLDDLALMFYDNPTLYWIIADFNRIVDPFILLSKGSVVKIPVYSNITYI